jgi:ubiquitin-protein ligase
MRSNKRIPKEIANGLKSTQFKFVLDENGDWGPSGSCYLLFKPIDGPYKNQEHILRIQWIYGANDDYQYPNDPPNITFMTPILHSNIGVTGIICLDILKKGNSDSCKYSPMYGIEAFYQSIVGLLLEPHPGSPLNGDAARIYNTMKDKPEYISILDNYYNTRIVNYKILNLFK